MTSSDIVQQHGFSPPLQSSFLQRNTFFSALRRETSIVFGAVKILSMPRILRGYVMRPFPRK
jgi:hypothetical protein